MTCLSLVSFVNNIHNGATLHTPSTTPQYDVVCDFVNNFFLNTPAVHLYTQLGPKHVQQVFYTRTNVTTASVHSSDICCLLRVSNTDVDCFLRIVKNMITLWVLIEIHHLKNGSKSLNIDNKALGYNSLIFHWL